MMTILIKLNLLQSASCFKLFLNAEIQIPEALAGYIVYHMTGYLVLVIVKITETKGWRGVRKSNFQSFHPNNLLVLLKI